MSTNAKREVINGSASAAKKSREALSQARRFGKEAVREEWDDTRSDLESKLEAAQGRISELSDQIRDKAAKVDGEVRERVGDSPWLFLTGATAIGYLIGRFTTRK